MQRRLPLFPLSTVLFPGMVLPLHIFEDRYKKMIQDCRQTNNPFGVLFAKEGLSFESDKYPSVVGTTALITEIEDLEDGRMNIATLGVERFRVVQFDTSSQPYLQAIIEDFPLDERNQGRIRQEAKVLGGMLMHYLNQVAKLAKVNLPLEKTPDTAESLAFLTAMILRTSMEEKQMLLSIESLADLLLAEKDLLSEEIRELKLLTSHIPQWYDTALLFSPN